MKGRYKKVIVGVAATVGATACGLMASGVAGAQGLSEVELLGTQVNLLLVIIGAVLVIFMQAGFALVETGFCRAKHAAHVVSTNFAIFGLGFVGLLPHRLPADVRRLLAARLDRLRRAARRAR